MRANESGPGRPHDARPAEKRSPAEVYQPEPTPNLETDPPPAASVPRRCARCKHEAPLMLSWRTFADGEGHIAGNCRSCGGFVRWVAQDWPATPAQRAELTRLARAAKLDFDRGGWSRRGAEALIGSLHAAEARARARASRERPS